MTHTPKFLLVSLFVSIAFNGMAFTSEIRVMSLPDKASTTTRLCLPEKGDPKTIVVVVHGTGPYTYMTKRTGFNYYDVLANGFCEQGVGFFSYNRRGVDLGDTAPMFDKVDSTKYTNYLPHIEVRDIESMISTLKKDKRLKNCKIILYGISEGTIIASMVAERNKVKVDGLFLHGYAHENMYDIIQSQNMGEGIMVLINAVFDKNGDKSISREEYETDDPTFPDYRKYLFNDLAFDAIDLTKDNAIDLRDIHKMRTSYNTYMMSKISENDQSWIWNNYFRITIAWLKEHFALEPNKSRLLRITIPIHIFHGTQDINVPVEGVYDIENRFKISNKQNLTIHVFDKHDHDLNFNEWITNKKYSEGLQSIFNNAAKF